MVSGHLSVADLVLGALSLLMGRTFQGAASTLLNKSCREKKKISPKIFFRLRDNVCVNLKLVTLFSSE